MADLNGFSPEHADDLNELMAGHTPSDPTLMKFLTVGLDDLTAFVCEHYLRTYIPAGGSKIRMVTGRPGCGKTHFAACMRGIALEESFLVVSFSAKTVWLNDLRDIYLQALKQCNLPVVLRGCADSIVREMGFDPADIPAGKTLMDMLAERGEGDVLTKNELRSALRKYFTRNPMLDSSFAGCCSLLVGNLLGHPVLEPANQELILACLNGEKGIRPAQMRALGLSPVSITKFTARHLLRSLAELIHLAGYQGLMIVIDDLETLLNRTEGNGNKYTKLRREDAYECIRQLIDDIDSMRHVLFLLCFDRELMDNEDFGMKSYQALWLRVQNEVVSNRLNFFSDILDLDRYGSEYYTPDALQEMSRRLVEVLAAKGITKFSLDEDAAAKLLERARYGRMGLPYLANRTVMEGEKADV